MKQLVEKIDPRVLAVMGDCREKLPILKAMLLSEERPGWVPDDTVDVSILPPRRRPG